VEAGGKTVNVGEDGASGWESGGRAKAGTDPDLEEGRLVELVESHVCYVNKWMRGRSDAQRNTGRGPGECQGTTGAHQDFPGEGQESLDFWAMLSSEKQLVLETFGNRLVNG
jgi:hypothetical protein